ncbi:hypothetical protein RHGRI_015078 [Rhododendron griersonianum]|uniref:Uncharacterized protein n=1 Tax=Rhododendron griersonianum TaxID=479676 RepID=A0AAV6KBZ4_9ERIC|nr:hypothetical protein RHGRI_015078 [Rhododendron griersonianum]
MFRSLLKRSKFLFLLLILGIFWRIADVPFNAMLDGYRQYNCQNVSIVFNIPPQNIERSNAYFVDSNIRVEGVSAEAMR